MQHNENDQRAIMQALYSLEIAVGPTNWILLQIILLLMFIFAMIGVIVTFT